MIVELGRVMYSAGMETRRRPPPTASAKRRLGGGGRRGHGRPRERRGDGHQDGGRPRTWAGRVKGRGEREQVIKNRKGQDHKQNIR